MGSSSLPKQELKFFFAKMFENLHDKEFRTNSKISEHCPDPCVIKLLRP